MQASGYAAEKEGIEGGKAKPDCDNGRKLGNNSSAGRLRLVCKAFLTAAPAPFGILETNIRSTISHDFTSVRASMNCCHLNSLDLIPVMLFFTRKIALLRSSSLRNEAFIGASGSRKYMQADQAIVMAPYMRNIA